MKYEYETQRVKDAARVKIVVASVMPPPAANDCPLPEI